VLHQQEVGGTSKNEIAWPPECVDCSFDCEQYLGRALNFIQNDRARRQQRVGIPLGLIEHTYIIESEICPRWSNSLREFSLASLPSPG
jgi:hypothetical protein